MRSSQSHKLNMNLYAANPLTQSESAHTSNKETLPNFPEYSNLYFKTLKEIKLVTCYKNDCTETVEFQKVSDSKTKYMCRSHHQKYIKKRTSRGLLKKIEEIKNSASEFDGRKRKKLVGYIQNYNDELRKLKKSVFNRISHYTKKIENELMVLIENIDAIVEKNTRKITKISNKNTIFFENVGNLENFLDSNFKSDFLSNNKKLQISEDIIKITEGDLKKWILKDGDEKAKKNHAEKSRKMYEESKIIQDKIESNSKELLH